MKVSEFLAKSTVAPMALYVNREDLQQDLATNLSSEEVYTLSLALKSYITTKKPEFLSNSVINLLAVKLLVYSDIKGMLQFLDILAPGIRSNGYKLVYENLNGFVLDSSNLEQVLSYYKDLKQVYDDYLIEKWVLPLELEIEKHLDSIEHNQGGLPLQLGRFVERAYQTSSASRYASLLVAASEVATTLNFTDPELTAVVNDLNRAIAQERVKD